MEGSSRFLIVKPLYNLGKDAIRMIQMSPVLALRRLLTFIGFAWLKGSYGSEAAQT